MIILLLLVAALVLSEPLDVRKTYTIDDICVQELDEFDVIEMHVWRGTTYDWTPGPRVKVIKRRTPSVVRTLCMRYGEFTILHIAQVNGVESGTASIETSRLLVPTEVKFRVFFLNSDDTLRAVFATASTREEYLAKFGVEVE